jgi:predicted RNA binding protein YcfA (HicA-like mRNA interferase family)
VKGDDLIKKLKAKGWVHTHTNGSHKILKEHGSEFTLSAPCHAGKDLAPGILHDLMKKGGLK